VDEEPEPFILEVRHDTTPWRVDDVTADVLQAAEQVRREAHEAQQDTEQKALVAFVRALREAPMNQTAAERFLVAEGCHRSRARHLLKEGVGDRFVRRQVKGRGGAAGTGTLLYEAAEGG
jgi:hypothetical protein